MLQVSYLYNWIARDSFTFCSELHAVFVLHIVFIRDVRILSGWLEILFFLAPIGAQEMLIFVRSSVRPFVRVMFV